MTDRELVDQILICGKSAFFSQIVERYSRMVFARSLSVVRREELATEVSQQTFIRAWHALADWRGTNLGPWLCTIASHLSLNCVQKEQLRHTEELSDRHAATVDTDSEQLHRREELLQRLEKAMAELQESDRNILRMHYYEQLSTREISERTGLSQSNVLVKLHRIREKLKVQLINEEYGR